MCAVPYFIWFGKPYFRKFNIFRTNSDRNWRENFIVPAVWRARTDFSVCFFVWKTEENAWTCGYLVLTFGKWYSGPCFEIIILDSESLWTCARCVQDTVIRKRAEVTAGGKSTIHVRRVAFELSNKSGVFMENVWICKCIIIIIYYVRSHVIVGGKYSSQ